MNEIQPTTVQIKTSEGHETKWCLVHDGTTVVALTEPGAKLGTPPGNKMLVGTKAELDAEIARLKLAPTPSRAPIPKGRRDAATRASAAEER